jgi:hypothetical protein
VSLGGQLIICRVNDGRQSILSQPSRTVAIVLAIVQVLEVVVLELLLQRQVVELPSEGKLSVDLFLADAEVLHVEEADMLCSISELFGQLLLAVWSVEEAQVESYQLGPVDLMIELELNDSILQIIRTYGRLWSLGLVCTEKELRLA